MKYRIIFVAGLMVVLLLIRLMGVAAPQMAKPSVILIIADGLGLNLQELVRLTDGPLAVDKMAAMALVRIHSLDNVATDSAAAATAMATGKKVRNNALSLDENRKPLLTVAEVAKRAGYRLGFITSSFVFDATPMAFLVHVYDRKNTDAIAKQVLAAQPDLLMGGGEALFLPPSKHGVFGRGVRKDGLDMLAEFRNAGYQVSTTPMVGPLPSLVLAGRHALFEVDGVAAPPSARDATMAMFRAALRMFEGTSGFFLLVEEEETDEASHANDLQAAMDAVRRWDALVAEALHYQREHPNTVVLVTSDHDTGGLQLLAPDQCKRGVPGSLRLKARLGFSICAQYTTQKHTGAPVALYAEGLRLPSQMIDNTEIHRILSQTLRFDKQVVDEK